MHVETWNEWHEGTDIAHSRAYGRSYLVLTRRFADMERTVVQLRFGPGYVDVHSVAGESELPAARTPRPSAGDGRWQLVPHEVGKAAITRRNPHSETTRYLDFEVDDPFAFGVRGTSAEIAVTCVMRDSRLSAASTATWFPRGLWRVHFDRPEVSP